MKDIILKQISSSINVKTAILNNEAIVESIAQAALKITNAYKAGNKTLIAGNGGSAADAQHLAGEFVSRFYFDRPGIPSIALSTDTSILTAIGNDYGYEKVFSRQVQAYGVKGDVFIGISTSGNSINILNAIEECKSNGMFSIGLTGQSDTKMCKACDLCITVPSAETPRIQEAHTLIGHIICCIVEESLFGHLNLKK